MDKQKVYYASHIGTFELDAITGLVPNPVKPGHLRTGEPHSIRVLMGANSAVLVFASEEDRDGWRTRIEQEMGIVHDVAPALDGLDMGPPIVVVPRGVPVGAQGISGVDMAAQMLAAAPRGAPLNPVRFAETPPADIAQAVVAAVQHANRDDPAVPVSDSGFEKQVPLGTNGMTQGGPETAEPDPSRKRELGYCVVAGCMSPARAGEGLNAAPVDVLCREHSAIMDHEDPPPLCKMAGCTNTPGEGSIVCQACADTLNNTGRVDAG